jgi:molybdopterin-containing oxidoreductase family iron-sulfur binding subunit
MSDGIKRREFLKVLGVSGAGASMVGCSTEEVERLIPYVTPPEEITPGVATWYASTCNECSAHCGLWVKTREGRVVMVEGNPSHPISKGGLCSRGHSSLQGLYNPDRFTGPMARRNGQLEPITWEEAEQMLAERLRASSAPLLIAGGAGPSMSSVLEMFAEAAGVGLVRNDPLADAPLREAGRMAYARAAIPSYDLESADFILSFGADFLETWGSPVAYTKQFSQASGVDEEGHKSEFVFVGPRLGLTGMNADEWVPIAPGSEGLLALAMANVISAGGRNAGPYADIVSAFTPQSVAQATGLETDTIESLAERFRSAGTSVALGPGVAGQHRNATAANLAVLILNEVAGNVGTSVRYGDAETGAVETSFSDLSGAISAMQSGSVDLVMVYGCNPVFSTPGGAGFAAAYASVGFKVSFASTMDETAAQADLVLPDHHALESWGDAWPRPGVVSLQQPAMQPVPLFDSKATGDVLMSVAGLLGQGFQEATFYDFVRSRWAEASGTSGDAFEALWKDALRRGFLEVPVDDDGATALRTPDQAMVFDVPSFDGSAEDPVLVVYPSPRFGDGALNGNRPWLHELPDPVSKMAWHSWVEVNPHTAERMGLRSGDVVTVTSPHGSVEVPLWEYPGVREDVVALAMGGGHTDAGQYADGNGVNAMDLLPGEAEALSGSAVYMATRVSLAATGRRYKMATIEGSSTQSNRPITPAVAIAELGHAEEDHGEGHELKELQGVGGFVPVETEGRPQDYPLEGSQHGQYDPEAHPRWAMAIDLDKCTGCSACVTACQAENNVPWVGEQQVQMGRDMGWIRLERYYETVDATHAGPVDVRFMPMLCQHCNNAPCEPVCPVYATYHSPNGINQQVYNRCVGTRYCANNCPYKVRVFNWYRYTDAIPEPLNWQWNPDVTVRDNGVMEKCSFCIQRIREAENLAKIEGREGVPDGAVVPACQSTCPADAIVFGNIKDPTSRVAEVVESERTYRVLDELINTQPGVSYLKKVTFHDVESGEH